MELWTKIDKLNVDKLSYLLPKCAYYQYHLTDLSVANRLDTPAHLHLYV
jgi:hypothetical protein